MISNWPIVEAYDYIANKGKLVSYTNALVSSLSLKKSAAAHKDQKFSTKTQMCLATK